MISAALSLDLSRWVGILPGGSAHLLDSLRMVSNEAFGGFGTALTSRYSVGPM